jgi:hypothetical protein
VYRHLAPIAKGRRKTWCLLTVYFNVKKHQVHLGGPILTPLLPPFGAKPGRAGTRASAVPDAAEPGLRHGVSTVTRGSRTALGVIFHDAR